MWMPMWMSMWMPIWLLGPMLLAQQPEPALQRPPAGADLPRLLRGLEEGFATGRQLSVLGEPAQAAVLGLWLLAPQPARAKVFAAAFDLRRARSAAEEQVLLAMVDLLGPEDALVRATLALPDIALEPVLPRLREWATELGRPAVTTWVDQLHHRADAQAGNLQAAQRTAPTAHAKNDELEGAMQSAARSSRDSLLEQLTSGTRPVRCAVLQQLIRGSDEDALAAYERLLALETEPDTAEESRDLQLLLHAMFASRTRRNELGADEDHEKDRVLAGLRRHVLTGRLIGKQSLDRAALAELGSEGRRLLACSCLGQWRWHVGVPLRPDLTVAALRAFDDRGLHAMLDLVECLRRIRGRQLASRLRPSRVARHHLSAVLAELAASDLRDASPEFWREVVDACLVDSVPDRGRTESPWVRLLRRDNAEHVPRGLVSLLPELAGNQRFHWVSRMVAGCDPLDVAHALHAVAHDPKLLQRWLGLLVTAMPRYPEPRMHALVTQIAAEVCDWPPAAQAYYVSLGPEAVLPATSWPALLAVADLAVRRRAAEAAWRHHFDNGPTIAMMGALLRDEDEQVVAFAANFCMRQKEHIDEAACELLAACDAAPPVGRASILRVLGALGVVGAEVEAVAMRARDHEHFMVRSQARCLLLRLSPDDAERQQAVAAICEDSSAQQRQDALFAAGNLGEAAAKLLPVALRHLRDEDEMVCAAAARLLAAVPSYSAIAHVVLSQRRAEVGVSSSFGRRLTGYLEVIGHRESQAQRRR